MIGQWASAEGEAEYAEAYALAMAEMPRPARTYDLKTSFGVVRAYEWPGGAESSAIPLVLLPGRGSGVPMWGENLEGLVRRERVFAFDALGDAGMGSQSAPLKDCEDQALWLEECFAALNLAKVHLAGHSFGGWLAANYASRRPSRVASLSLIEPVFVFQSIRPSIVLASIPYSLKFLPESWRKGLTGAISGGKALDRSDPVARMIDDGTSYYISRLPQPRRISAEQMGAWTFPVYLALGGKSALHDAEKGLAVARESVKALSGRIWPEGTHSLPMEYPGEIDEALCGFIDSSLQ